MLNLYSSRGKDSEGNQKFMSDNHRLMVYTNQYIYPWHVNRTVFPNEKLTPEQKKPVGYFVFHQGAWRFVNQRLHGMKVVGEDEEIAISSMVELKNDQKLLLSPENGGRLAHVQMVKSS